MHFDPEKYKYFVETVTIAPSNEFGNFLACMKLAKSEVKVHQKQRGLSRVHLFHKICCIFPCYSINSTGLISCMFLKSFNKL
jgi:hypothetical protein